MSGTYSHTGPQEAWIRVPTEQEGVCGSACFGLSDGTVAGMYRNAAAWHSGLSRLTVASDISKLVESVGNKPSLSVVEKPGVQIRSSFSLPDKYAAIQSFKNILDKKFPDRTEPDFMHSHIIRVPVDLNDGLHQLAMQIQYLPTQRQMSLRPVALDNKRLTGKELWKNTQVPIYGAELNLRFLGQIPARMQTVNDPLNFLVRSLNTVDSSGYLAGLKPSRVE